jgi:hypothetical protein
LDTLVGLTDPLALLFAVAVLFAFDTGTFPIVLYFAESRAGFAGIFRWGSRGAGKQQQREKKKESLFQQLTCRHDVPLFGKGNGLERSVGRS